MKFYLNIALLLGIAFLTLSNGDGKKPLRKEIDKIIYYEAKINFKDVPGFIVGIIKQDSVQYFSYGSLYKKRTMQPTKNTLFELGGMTKVFTATLIEDLVQEGKLHYDSLLNSYLPSHLINPTATNVTLLDIISHRSGLPRLPTDFGIKELEPNNPYAHYTKRDLIGFYKKFNFPQGKQKYHYSHVNYALLEIVVENLLNKSFENVLRERILDPMQLLQTGIDLDKYQRKMLALGYSNIGKPISDWKFQSFEGSVGLKSSAEDLMKFVKIQLAEESPFQLLTSSMHAKIDPTFIDKNSHIAKGWHVLENKRYFDVIAHTGNTDGHRSFMGFVKETQTGVIVLSNSESSTNGLGYHILRMLNNNWKKRK